LSRIASSFVVFLLAALAATTPAALEQSPASAAQESHVGDELWHHRNLGKAFYENPTTQRQAVDEFKKALALAPGSARERLNYALSLLRAGQTADAIAELQRVQQQDPSLPHTWFNLGIAYKKDSQYDKAIAQFEQMVKLAPNEPISHYNLGYLYKLTDKPADALREFERAAALDPNLAARIFNCSTRTARPAAQTTRSANSRRFRRSSAARRAPRFPRISTGARTRRFSIRRIPPPPLTHRRQRR